jgi:hypothetical protein
MGILTKCNCAAGPWQTTNIPKDENGLLLIDFGGGDILVYSAFDETLYSDPTDYNQFSIPISEAIINRWARIRK